MRELVVTARFERSYRRLVAKSPSTNERIRETLRRMSENLEDPRLKTHRLSGQLTGFYACSVAFDCRIVFKKEKCSRNDGEVLLLVNIGSHEEVY